MSWSSTPGGFFLIPAAYALYWMWSGVRTSAYAVNSAIAAIPSPSAPARPLVVGERITHEPSDSCRICGVISNTCTAAGRGRAGRDSVRLALVAVVFDIDLVANAAAPTA